MKGERGNELGGKCIMNECNEGKLFLVTMRGLDKILRPQEPSS